MSTKPQYTAKVDALLKHVAALGFTEQDFADMAVAAADQSGLDAAGADARSASRRHEVDPVTHQHWKAGYEAGRHARERIVAAYRKELGA